MEDLKMRNNKDGVAAALQPKKIAVINDIAGYGRCALTAAIPVISALKVQCCPLYHGSAVEPRRISIPLLTIIRIVWCLYIEEWKRLEFSFDGPMTGFRFSSSGRDCHRLYPAF